jgi:hypothetical protein
LGGSPGVIGVSGGDAGESGGLRRRTTLPGCCRGESGGLSHRATLPGCYRGVRRLKPPNYVARVMPGSPEAYATELRCPGDAGESGGLRHRTTLPG